MSGVKDYAKRLLKNMAANPEAANSAPRILTYHSVGERPHSMNVTPSDFENQMAWLAEFATVRGVEEILEGKAQVAITFDDGYKDNLTHVLPIMDRLSLPWTVFVVTGRLGEWLDHDDRIDSAQLMSESELRTLVEAGVSVGGHTVAHRRLSALSAEDQRIEIFDCKRALDDLGVDAPGFAYPFGSALDYDQTTMNLVQEAGFAYALSNRYGPVQSASNPWHAERIWIDSSDTLATFQQKVRGELDSLRWLDSGPMIRTRRVVNSFLRAR